MSGQAKILLFGASGQLGSRLQQACKQRSIECVALARSECDFSAINTYSIDKLIATHAPTHIINATAFTAVDKAESQRELAFAINATAPKIIANAAQKYGIPFIHFSTDYVFDGARGAPYQEHAPTRPLNVYGQSKLAGEQAARDAGATIFRLQWVYDVRGANFLLQMRKNFAAQQTMRIVADQWGAPTFAKHIAQAVLDGLNVSADIYHLTAGGFTSWHGFACEIHAAIPRSLTRSIIPISTAEYPLAAVRPLDTRLITDKIAAYDIALPHWQIGVREAMEELNEPA